MVVAIIVTYNRKELLAENIRSLLIQNRPFDRIFIVDNCSTDGTYEYLKERGWTCSPFEYIKTDENIGGAGGFYFGLKKAYESGADWFVLMDDDGYAEDAYTFNILMEQAFIEYKSNPLIFANALVHQGELLSFKMGNAYTVQEELEKARDGVVFGEANPFNGTVVSRELITKIGYPNKDFFIKGDEVNYKQRAIDADAVVFTVVNSRYVHPRPETYERKILGIKVPFFVEAPWKEYYAARNFTYMYRQKRQYKAIVFELIFVKLLAIMTMKCKKMKTVHMLLKGVWHGWQGKLGTIVKP